MRLMNYNFNGKLQIFLFKMLASNSKTKIYTLPIAAIENWPFERVKFFYFPPIFIITIINLSNIGYGKQD